MSTSLRLVRTSLAVTTLLFGASCGSTTPGALGGPVTGAIDDHCTMNDAMTMQKVGMCMVDAPGGGDAAAPADDASADAGDDSGAPTAEGYPPPLFNSDGYDDDCKYHVSLTATPVRLNADVTFTVAVTGLDPAGPATGAQPYAEVTLGDNYVSPSPNTKGVETPAGSGIYKFGPFKLDRAGEWVVRFHLYGECSDTPADSPHAHVAFRINVP